MNTINLSLFFAAFHGVQQLRLQDLSNRQTAWLNMEIRFYKQPHPFIQYLNDDKLNIKGTILTTNNMTTSPNTLQFHLNIDKYKVIIWSSILYMSWSLSKIFIGKCVLKSIG